jgi:hypothetical protein
MESVTKKMLDVIVTLVLLASYASTHIVHLAARCMDVAIMMRKNVFVTKIGLAKDVINGLALVHHQNKVRNTKVQSH